MLVCLHNLACIHGRLLSTRCQNILLLESSLVVQWLGLSPSTAMVPSSVPRQRTKTPQELQ